jgi:DNA-damage-inducible protein J
MISKSSVIHARVEPTLKIETEKTLNELGLNMTQAINIFFQQIKLHKGLPFEVKIPNAKTKKALKEAKNRIGKSFNTVDELFEDLKN